jgi:mobilome CxxCx(11)CxxC protein
MGNAERDQVRHRQDTDFYGVDVPDGRYQMEISADVDPRNNELWDHATDAFGTAEIFRKRAGNYKGLVRFLTFFGLVIPIVIGGIVLANLLKEIPLQQVVYYAGVLSVAQAVIFLWSVVANWPESLDYSSGASADNLRLSGQLKDLAIQSVKQTPGFNIRYAEVKAMYDAQVAQDARRNIIETEKRLGMRAGLLQFGRACSLCHVVPPSMEMPFLSRNRCPRCGGPKTNEPAKDTKNPQHN